MKTLLLFLTMFFVSMTSVTHAAVRYVKWNASGSNDGTSWENAYTSFQPALTAAVSGDEIWAAQGTYNPTTQAGGTGARFATFQMKNGVTIYGGFAGTEYSVGQRTDFGEGGVNETILSGDIGTVGTKTDNCYHVFYHPDGLGLTSTAVLDGFTISGGYGVINADHEMKGGAMHNNAGNSPTLRQCVFTDNASCFGGAIYNYGLNTKPTMVNCIFKNNNAYVTASSTGWGGAIYNTTKANVTIINSLIFNNTAEATGGGIYNYSSSGSYASNATIINTTIANNTAVNGGGIRLLNFSDATLQNCIVWGNVSNNNGNQFLIESGCMMDLYYTCYSNSVYDVSGNITVNTACITTNPAFVNAPADFRIFGISPCADAGIDSYNIITTDLRGTGFGRKLLKTNPYITGTIDMGAYEYNRMLDPLNNTCADPFYGGKIAESQTICYNTAPNELTSDSLPSGHLGVLEYKWQMSTTSEYTGYADISNSNSTTYNPGTLTVSTWYRRLARVTCMADWSGAVASSRVVTITVASTTAGGSVSGSATVCSSPNSTVLTLTGATGSVMRWEHSTDNWATKTTVANYNYTLTATDITATTKYRAVVKSGPCSEENSAEAAITLGSDYIRKYVTVTGAGAKNGTSWADAYQASQLQTAISSNSCVNEVWVAAGTYKPTTGSDRTISFIMKNGVAIYGGFSGSETNLAQRNWTTNVTILSGDLLGNDGPNFTNCSDNSYHVIYNYNNGLNSTAILDGFTITGGYNSAYNDYGGGMYNYLSSPGLANCTFTANYAYDGGGMSNNSSSPSITNCIFSGNSADYEGGGMYNTNFTGSIINCTFSTNSAISDGGGIYNFSFSGSITNCIVWGNTGGGSQGIYGSATVTYSIVQGASVYPGTGNLLADPKFVNAAGSDFRLFDDSPAKNTGNNAANATATDIRGQARIQNTTIDMGAYEWTSGLDPRYMFTWTGNTSTDWNNTGNWDSGVIPSNYANVTIPHVSRDPIVNEAPAIPAICNNLSVASGAVLTIAADKALTVSGTLANSENEGLIIESGGSLIHNSNNVAATVKQTILGSSSLNLNKYHFVSIPTQYATPKTELFTGSYMYKLDPLQQISPPSNPDYGKWVGMGSSTTTPLNLNQGYMIYYPGESHEYTFTGNLNNETFSYALTGHSGTGINTYNLVPNPYPSSIIWNTAGTGWTKSPGIGGTCYIWNAASGNYSSIASSATAYIPAGQALMVLVSNEASPTLSVNNTARVHSSQPFYKSAGIANQLTIKATANDYADETVVRFIGEATEGFDLQADGMKLPGQEDAPQLYTVSGGEKLSINNLPEFPEQAAVQMNFETNYTGNVTLVFSKVETFPANMSIKLEDKLTGRMTNLQQQQSYIFAHQPGNAADRFLLHFNGATGVEEPGMARGNLWIFNNTVNIYSPATVGEKALVEIFNTAGQVVFSKQVTLSELTKIPVSTVGFAVIRVTSSKEVMVKKGFFR